MTKHMKNATSQRPAEIRVALVAEQASAALGGEAALPYHYFRVLRNRGVDVWLVVHARTRPELTKIFPDEKRIFYVEDTGLHALLWRLAKLIPARVDFFTTGFLSRLLTQRAQRKILRGLVATEDVNIIHQPIPVSPRDPSIMYGFNVPVFIGPMNGGINYPPGFARYQGNSVSALVHRARLATDIFNWILPGKLKCAVLFVANQRTRVALPSSPRAKVIELVENGVDLAVWADRPQLEPTPGRTDYLFMGRLIDWKAVDLLLVAFQRASQESSMT